MRFNNIYLSDHLYSGSDTYEKPFKAIITEAAREAIAHTEELRPSHYSRLPHRALQALWQSRLQMHERQGAWTQILFDLERLQRQAGCHLRPYRSTGERKSLPRKVSIVECRTQESLRYQSRASATRRHDIGNCHVHRRADLGCCPEKRSGNFSCQHVGITIAQRLKPLFPQGGFQ
jgi:hypothetical protein